MDRRPPNRVHGARQARRDKQILTQQGQRLQQYDDARDSMDPHDIWPKLTQPVLPLGCFDTLYKMACDDLLDQSLVHVLYQHYYITALSMELSTTNRIRLLQTLNILVNLAYVSGFMVMQGAPNILLHMQRFILCDDVEVVVQALNLVNNMAAENNESVNEQLWNHIDATLNLAIPLHRNNVQIMTWILRVMTVVVTNTPSLVNSQTMNILMRQPNYMHDYDYLESLFDIYKVLQSQHVSFYPAATLQVLNNLSLYPEAIVIAALDCTLDVYDIVAESIWQALDSISSFTDILMRKYTMTLFCIIQYGYMPRAEVLENMASIYEHLPYSSSKAWIGAAICQTRMYSIEKCLDIATKTLPRTFEPAVLRALNEYVEYAMHQGYAVDVTDVPSLFETAAVQGQDELYFINHAAYP
jgi:hypothetical protein